MLFLLRDVSPNSCSVTRIEPGRGPLLMVIVNMFLVDISSFLSSFCFWIHFMFWARTAAFDGWFIPHMVLLFTIGPESDWGLPWFLKLVFMLPSGPNWDRFGGMIWKDCCCCGRGCCCWGKVLKPLEDGRYWGCWWVLGTPPAPVLAPYDWLPSSLLTPPWLLWWPPLPLLWPSLLCLPPLSYLIELGLLVGGCVMKSQARATQTSLDVCN